MNRRLFLKYLSSFCLFKGVQAIGVDRVFGSVSRLPAADKDDAPQPSLALSKKSLVADSDGNIVLDPRAAKQFHAILKRLFRLQRTVGYGHFCLLNFDEMRHIASSYASIGEFPQIEIAYLEELFYRDAALYGFKGAKTLHHITDTVDKQLAVKIPASGNYLYRGISLQTYRSLSQDVGNELILTAGIRGIVKQFYLFLSKALRHNGNLSLASRSIAPPGYSFHGTGDFDVGKAGFGIANFSERFTRTDTYAKLKSLDYVKFRYPPDNSTGVVFEPWHIQVV